MAYRVCWKFTNLPKEIANIIDLDLMENFGHTMQTSTVSSKNKENKELRDSQNAWIPHEHWCAGFVWHYVQMLNKENFLYDIDCIDNGNLQYTQYTEGQYYDWHYDETIENGTAAVPVQVKGDEFVNRHLTIVGERPRKLSFVVQLSDPDDYEGGNLLFMGDNNNEIVAPRHQGSVIVFDSRTKHKACEVTKGVRRSLVGWVNGPRWR